MLRRQSQPHEEWEERVALGLERGARGGATSAVDEARATSAQVRHRVRHSGHPALLRPQGTAASRSSTSAGPSAGSSGSVSRAGRGSAPSHQPPGPWGDHQRSWGFGIGPEGSVGLEWARGGGGGGRTRV